MPGEREQRVVLWEHPTFGLFLPNERLDGYPTRADDLRAKGWTTREAVLLPEPQEEEGGGLARALEKIAAYPSTPSTEARRIARAALAESASTPGLSEKPRAGKPTIADIAAAETHARDRGLLDRTFPDATLPEAASTPGLSDHLHPPPCRSCGVRSQDVSLHAPDCLFRVEAEKARRPLAESASTPERCPRCKTVHPPGYPCPDSA